MDSPKYQTFGTEIVGMNVTLPRERPTGTELLRQRPKYYFIFTFILFTSPPQCFDELA